MNRSSYTRRQLLKLAGITGGGLVVGVSLNACSLNSSPIQQGREGFTPDAFIQVKPNNQVVFYLPRDEMGQGVYMGLTTLIGEELNLSPASIHVEFAPASGEYRNPRMHFQITGGSTSMTAHFHSLRQSAANAGAMLLAGAAKALDVNGNDLALDQGRVMHQGRELGSYGDFTVQANQVSLGEDAKLKPKSAFKYIGSELPRIDAMQKSTGTASYGIDIDLPDMQWAVVKRCPVAGGTVISYDSARAASMPGVSGVYPIFSGIAVLADHYWQANNAAQALDIEWDLPALSRVSSADIERDYRKAKQTLSAELAHKKGAGADALATTKTRHSATYWLPYLAHAPLEPMNATVRIQNNECDVWTGCQSPRLAQGLAARYSGVPMENVRVHNQFLGGGFGRRGVLSHVGEAAELARKSGKAVQVLWSREDDIRHGVYRPASLIEMNAGLNPDNKIETWSALRVGANCSPDVYMDALPGMAPSVSKGIQGRLSSFTNWVFEDWLVDDLSVEGLSADYSFDNEDIRHITVDHGLPVSYWRSVGHSFTAFAKECMMDEMAEAAGQDPVQFRLAHVKSDPRIRQLIEAAGVVYHKGPSRPDRFLGLAVHTSYNTHVAQVAEISVQDGLPTVHRVSCIVDCGLVVNPPIVREQMASGIVFGLTAALYGEITLKNGAVEQSNFHDYPLLRINETPEVDVTIIDSDADPTGVGEPGVPPIAPAVANAMYQATGTRVRSLPFRNTAA